MNEFEPNEQKNIRSGQDIDQDPFDGSFERVDNPVKAGELSRSGLSRVVDADRDARHQRQRSFVRKAIIAESAYIFNELRLS